MQNSKVGRGARGWLWIVLCVAAGCGLDSSEASSLAGRTFLLESAEGFEPVAGTLPRIRFESGELSFTAGCNSHGGRYTLRGGRLNVTGLGSTDIGCDQPLHTQDEWLAAFITSSPRVTLDGDRLTLTGDDATLVFLDSEVADPDRPLEGTLWIVDTMIANGGASSLTAANPPEIQFDPAGINWQAFTGCTGLGGDYAVEGDAITIDRVLVSGCTEPPSPVDTHIHQVMSDGVITFEIDADRLILTRGNLGLGAHAE